MKKRALEITGALVMVPVVVLMIVAGVFIGDITGQVVRGQTNDFSGAEFGVIFSACLIAAEFAIISFRRKKKPVNVKELVKEARKITY